MQGPKILGDNDRSLTSAHLRCHDAALYLYATVYQCAVSDFFNKIDCHNKTEILLKVMLAPTIHNCFDWCL